MSAPELSLLIVNYNTWRLCVDAVETFCQHPPLRADGTPMSFEVIVVDNASPLRDQAAEDELAARCEATGGTLLRHDQNSGYSIGMNLAYARARGDWIVVSNPDIRYIPSTVSPLLRAMERDPRIGAAAPRGYWETQCEGMLPPNILPTLADLFRLTAAGVSPAGVRRYSKLRTRNAVRVWDARADVELTMLSGCCFVMRRELIERIGFFDERFPLYYEDTDLSQRIRRAGRRIVQVDRAAVIHLYDRSGQTDPSLKMERYWRSRRLYYRKWYGPIGGWIYDATRWFEHTGWAKRRNARHPYPDFVDLGAGHGKPVIRLPRAFDRVLIEFSLDPRFQLAGGIIMSGSEWTPNDEMFRAFGPTHYWFRVVDLADRRQPVIGVYRYQQLYPAISMPNSPEADARARRRLQRFEESGQWA